MSAETLRRAAALMRDRAEAATPGPWQFEPEGAYTCSEPACCSEYWDNRIWGGGVVIAESHLTSAVDSAHIASWHPAVALAVADWLDEVAERQKPTHHYGRRNHGWTGSRFANAVARAYLGGDA